jgi:hypothetical protein
MKGTVLIIQVIQLAQTSYMMLVIKNLFLLRAVQFVARSLITLATLGVRPFEISVI